MGTLNYSGIKFRFDYWYAEEILNNTFETYLFLNGEITATLLLSGSQLKKLPVYES